MVYCPYKAIYSTVHFSLMIHGQNVNRDVTRVQLMAKKRQECQKLADIQLLKEMKGVCCDGGLQGMEACEMVSS